MQALDFHHVIDFIKAEKGLADYPAPLGPDCRKIDPELKNPRFPGDTAYSNGPMFLERFEINVPQALIDAENGSIMDALRIFMNPRHVGAFLCTFYRGDFLSDPSF